MDDYNDQLNKLKKQAKLVCSWQYSRDRSDMIINVLLDLVEILCKQHEGIDTVTLADDITVIIESREK